MSDQMRREIPVEISTYAAADQDFTRCPQDRCVNDFYNNIRALMVSVAGPWPEDIAFYGPPENAVAVEYGCGDGRVLSFTAAKYAVENSSQMIDKSRSRSPNSTFLQADICEVSLPEKVTFSYAAGATLQNLPATAVAKFFANASANSAAAGQLRFDILCPERYYGNKVRGKLGEWESVESRYGFPCWERFELVSETHIVHRYLARDMNGELREFHLHEYVHTVDFIHEALEVAGWTNIVFGLGEDGSQTTPMPVVFGRATLATSSGRSA